MDAVGSFLMDQLLKMQWLSDLIAIFIDALGLDASSQWGGTLHFFRGFGSLCDKGLA